MSRQGISSGDNLMNNNDFLDNNEADLLRAVNSGNLEEVKTLVKKVGSVNFSSKALRYHTPLTLAAELGYCGIS